MTHINTKILSQVSMEKKLGWGEADIDHYIQDPGNTMLWTQRIHWSDFTVEKYHEVVVNQTTPLVVEGAMDHWAETERKLFELEWLRNVSTFSLSRNDI